ncbi:MAG: hypothetical protein AB7S92_21555 [Parvibaculaceae bacterium]
MTACGHAGKFIAMQRTLMAILFLLLPGASPAFSGDMLSAHEIRRIVPGNWSGTYKDTSLSLSVRADGTMKGRYGGIAASGSWAVKRKADGARFCLTIRLIISDTKCGELYRKGDNVLYGFSKHGKPRLWLRRAG